jgi:hypothetical protein
MPSLIAAPISTYSILSVFDDLIVRSNKILPPVFILAGSSLGYLTYHTWEKGVNGGVRRSGWIYPAAMGASLALQTVIVPRNTQMEESVRKGEGKGDQGEERNRRIGELLGLNWTGWW